MVIQNQNYNLSLLINHNNIILHYPFNNITISSPLPKITKE